MQDNEATDALGIAVDLPLVEVGAEAVPESLA